MFNFVYLNIIINFIILKLDFQLSSEDDNIDHYVAGIKDDLNNQYDDEDESSTDEDFNPEANDSDAKSGGDEEYDSDAADRSTDSEDRDMVIKLIE